jgi:uncharacterized protein
MKVALIGATGFVGTAVLQELLRRGHQVTALVRHPDKLAQGPHLIAKKMDVQNEADLATVLSGQEAVISAFNPGWGNPDIRSLMEKGSASILEATKRAGVKKIIFVGGAGSLQIAPGKDLLDTPDFPAQWREGAEGARQALKLFQKEKELDWAYVSPAINLVSGERTGKYQLGKDSPVFNSKKESKISVQDLAVAIVDELEKPKHHRERFTAAYA